MQMICFTNREKDVLTYLALGLNNQSIAKLLGISTKTVSSHKVSALAKIGIRKNSDLFKWLRTPDAKRTIVGDGT